MDSSQPIGIFDSGIGGLTVAYAVQQALPNEELVYFGDTAHFPYGDKSTAAIQSYTVKICDVLLKHNCKVILIACNSASSAAYQLAKSYVGTKAKVMNVIDPVVAYVAEHYAEKTVGVIGTKKTISSNVYQKKIDKLERKILLRSLATPLFAPMIEEGFYENAISEQIIHSYLSDPILSDIEALILGCTHYPLIKNQIEAYYQKRVAVIDSSTIVADHLKAYLEHTRLLKQNYEVQHRFYVSDYTRSFVESTRIFFRRAVQLENYPLWE